MNTNYTIEKVPYKFTNCYFVLRNHDQKILGCFDTNQQAVNYINNIGEGL